jgi:hypothetical protein
VRKHASRFVVAAVSLASLLLARPACAQSLTAEAAVSAGASTEDHATAAATEIRLFGDAGAGIRYFAETSWARTSSAVSDAFGAAYPYGNRVQVVESYGERMFRLHAALLSIRAGRFRTPFGISSGSDQGYSGFTRAPLVRYDGYFALSNDFLEHGANVMVGVPRLSLEASIGRPADIGDAVRRGGVDTIVRLQSYAGPLILGISHIRTSPYQPVSFAPGRADFTGVDARFMRDGVQLRGEFVAGRPFDGVTTTGWYADALIHRVGMGPVTAVARIEQLDYNTPVSAFVLHTKRQTAGARVRVVDNLSMQVDVLHQSGQLPTSSSLGALDVCLTYTVRRPWGSR